MEREMRSAECGVNSNIILKAMMTASLFIACASAEIKFEDVKGGKADPLGKNDLLSFRLLFNNLSTSGNAAFGNLVGLNPSAGAFYTREGKELAFSAYGHFGIATALDKNTIPRTAVTESRAYLAEWGLDLNYIISNANAFFWSAGLAEHSHLGGVIIEQNTLRYAMVPFTNLMGFDTRVRYYPLQEFFLTGQMGFTFLPVFAKEYQGYSTGAPAPDPGQTPVDVEGPTSFLFEFSGEYRPSSNFTFHGGIRYQSLNYKAADPSNANVATGKSLALFSPFFGVTIMY